jgi:hypothetical protein
MHEIELTLNPDRVTKIFSSIYILSLCSAVGRIPLPLCGLQTMLSDACGAFVLLRSTTGLLYEILMQLRALGEIDEHG